MEINMKKTLLGGVVSAALLTYVSWASPLTQAPVETEINLKIATNQKGRPQEKEKVEVNLSFKDGVLTTVKLLINSDKKLEEKTTQYNCPPSSKNLAKLILNKLKKEKKLDHPVDLITIHTLLKELIDKYEDGETPSPKKNAPKIKKPKQSKK